MRVMSTIHFDNESPLRAKEIDNVGPERRLPPESQAIKLAVSDDPPQLEFGRRQASAHHSAKMLVCRWDFLMRHSPSLAWLPLPENRGRFATAICRPSRKGRADGVCGLAFHFWSCARARY
jgi:hypothetical protein